MKEITLQEAKKEQRLIKRYLKDKRRIGKHEQQYLENRGFELEDLELVKVQKYIQRM
jgi:hypothetical protein